MALTSTRTQLRRTARSAFGWDEFLAPEQLGKPEVLDAVAAARPSLFVVDEAHCISSWGRRAGRDGQPAEAVLFYRPEDLGLRKFFASGAPDPHALQKVATLVHHADGAVEPTELAAEMDLSASRLTSMVNLLEQAGALTVEPSGSIESTDGPDPAEAAYLAASVAEAQRRVEQSRIDMMRGYAETTGCRRQYLLAYFGEEYGQECGNCDTCEAGTASAQPDAADSPYPLQSRVTHASWGEGVVMRYEGDRIVVLFEDVGYRTLLLETVQARGLLSPA